MFRLVVTSPGGFRAVGSDLKSETLCAAKREATRALREHPASFVATIYTVTHKVEKTKTRWGQLDLR